MSDQINLPNFPRLTPSQEILRYFKFDHLPEPLQSISKNCGDLAAFLEGYLPDGPEKTTGLRKLLEAKDCFIRAALPKAPAEPYIGPQTGAQYLDGLGNDKDGLR